MSRQGKGLIQKIAENFISSFKAKRIKQGNHVGTDYLGTKYFEVPADPQNGFRKPIRTFEPTIHEKFDQEVPPEWEAWLRGRRIEPPTEEEINRNLAIILLKEKNAAELSLKFPSKQSPNISQKKGVDSFPKYGEYEKYPGAYLDKEDKK